MSERMRRRKFIKVSAVGLAVGAGAAPGILREAVPLPDVKEAPAAAPRLEPEALGVAVRGVLATDASTLVPNPDGRTYDVLQWYYEDYSGPTWLYAIDLGSGQVKRQRFPDKRSIHLAGAALGPDGKYYLATPYHYYGAVREAARLGAPTGMELFVYDPATNTLEARGVIVPGLHGERRPLTLGPDGKLYGVGSYSKEGRVGVYAYDPRTHQVRDYGPVGPAHKGGVWADWGLSVDETHVYTLSGFTPYYLVAVDIATGADTVLLETQAGGEMRLRSGLSVEVIETHGAKPRTYWLHRGTAVAKTSETRPWPVPKAPQPASPPKPELHTGEVRPDAAGRARLWYRPARAAAGAAPPADGGWQAIVLEGIETYPLRVKLLAGLPDGRIFCKAEGHYGGSVFDPRLGRFTETGYCRTEDYACLAHAGKVYWTGYPSGEVWVYDPNRPWTHARGVPPGGQAVDKRSAASNPRSLGDFHAQRVSQMLSAAVGADGKLYLCGWGVRAYKGGAFCWVDLKTEARGGLWQPFIGYRTYWLATALERRYIVVSSAATRDGLNNWQAPPQGKLFVWDTQAGAFVREIEPVPRAEKTGPIVEVRPGCLMGIADDPDKPDAGTLYVVDVRTGAVLFRKRLPATAPVATSHTTAQCGYALGPDGYVWTFLGRGAWAPGTPTPLVRIAPDDGRVEPVGTLAELGNFIFMGNDLYLTGTEQLRRIRNVSKDGRQQHLTQDQR